MAYLIIPAGLIVILCVVLVAMTLSGMCPTCDGRTRQGWRPRCHRCGSIETYGPCGCRGER